MTEFAALAINQHRHEFVVPGFEHGVGIDIRHLDVEVRHTRLAAQGFQRSEHVVAQVAVVAAEQPQLRRRPAPGGLTYRAVP